MSTHVLWQSRHTPLPAQVAELERLLGPVELTLGSATFQSAGYVVGQYLALPEPHEIVFVGPLSVVQHLLKYNVQPLWAEMDTRSPRGKALDPEWEADITPTRRTRFVRFRRIVAVDVRFEELEATA